MEKDVCQAVHESKAIPTSGELLPDGTCLEQLRNGELCFVAAEQCLSAVRMESNGVTYEAVPIAADLASVLRIPQQVEPYLSKENLFAGLTELARRRAGMTPAASRLWAAGILTTHLAGAIVVPVLNLWGGAGETSTAAVQLTAALARRPLPLAELHWGELSRLPSGLLPTIIMGSQPSAVWLRHLLIAASGSGFVSLRHGQVVNFRCSLVVCTRPRVTFAALPIALGAFDANVAPLQSAELQSLADRWQPRLLDYRARCWWDAAQYGGSFAELSASMQPVARSVMAALAGSAGLQAQLLTDLSAIDEDYRSQQGEGAFGAVVEALLSLVLSRAPHAYVHEVCHLANQSLANRQEKAGLAPQDVGAIIREEVGLTTKRMTAGYRVPLDEAAAERIHSLAEELGIDARELSSSGSSSPCPATATKEPAVSAVGSGLLPVALLEPDEGRL